VEIQDLLEEMRHPSWSRRAEALREATARLAGDELDCEAEARLCPFLVEASKDPKWELRKAAALALAELRHTQNDVSEMALKALQRDSNRWVSQAAIRASHRLRARRNREHEWPLTEATRDPTLQLIADRIKQIGLRSMTPARIYDLATEVGDRYYRDLAADTAHEINTLLTPLEGYLAELRRRSSTDTTGERYLAKALERLHQVKILLDELRTYSAPNQDAFVAVDLEHVVRRAVTIGAERGASDASTVELLIEVPTGVVIEAVEERLVRALANLVANAYQAMSAGGALHVRGRAIGGASVEVSVSDTGRGMTAEQVEDAMERFRSTRKDEGGTGLGLPIAERIIVEDHGGELTVESTPGEGTRVIVVLPLRHDRGGE
jgi:signal transduction histidine kinase